MYLAPPKNIIYERTRFRERTQCTGKTTEIYTRVLYELAEHCAFANKEEEIQDKFVIGLIGKELSEKLQLTPERKSVFETA